MHVIANASLEVSSTPLAAPADTTAAVRSPRERTVRRLMDRVIAVAIDPSFRFRMLNPLKRSDLFQ